MSSLPRFLALSLFLLLALLVTALAAQVWLRQQERRLRAAAQQRLEMQLRAAVEVTARTEPRWTDARVGDVARLVGLPVRLAPGPEVAAEPATGVPPGPTVEVADGVWLAAETPLPAAGRFLFSFQRILVGLGLMAGLLLVALVGSLALRRPVEGTRSPFATQQRDVLSLAHLARTSESHRAERVRAEDEARVRLQLLNRALEEKIRIGRDLHDGVIQSLYAAGLTLQSAQPLTTSDPSEAARRIETTVDLLNRTIAEVRAYIAGLSPLSVRGHSVARALEDVVEELRAGRPVACEFAVDEKAAARLDDAQLIDALQVTREAVSNALRHGGAARLVVTLAAVEDGVQLQVRDDGRGFDPDARGGPGHGLANMRARAERGGGRFTLASRPGEGAQLTLVWPVSTL